MPDLSSGHESDSSDDSTVAGEHAAGEGDIQSDAFTRTSRPGCILKPTSRFIETMGAALSGFNGTAVELRYIGCLAELDHEEVNSTEVMAAGLEAVTVGAGVGGGFKNTAELKVMNYKQAMASDQADEWKQEVVNEKERFDRFKVLKAVPKEKVPKDAKIMTTT